ncbi:WD repeat-containing protein 62-like isoform X2 [Antennarius striatus]|uniref:WD repeat-containing protein 62-like isoform X2 n=1 Tax=Antennarius striatus TaxID=241820 RepID=UPI0035B4E359
MAEGADGGPVNPAKRRQTAGRKSRPSGHKKTSSSRVTLEKVLGISTSSGSGLTSDPNTGLIAYPAGCVIVLLHLKKNKQSHIINTSRKPFSALAFSHDGKYLATGEVGLCDVISLSKSGRVACRSVCVCVCVCMFQSGHMPCVRVWDVDGGQVAEVQSHKYGVSCVAFSINSNYIVSVGYQHDMTVSVWDWRKGLVIASNKVSSRVLSVSVSEDNSYFVTAGNRHVKFWYLKASKERRVNSTVPLIGRSALLGDHKNTMFSGVACGRGLAAGNTYCITSSGLLCLFNSSRHLEAWVDLKTAAASCLAVSEDYIFCGCADGVIRAFSPSHLQYVTTLPRPHRLGIDLHAAHSLGPAQHPDTVALTFDPASRRLTCAYGDHSLYVWDVSNVLRSAKLYSALYHSAAVWSVEVHPEPRDAFQPRLLPPPPSTFFTCSSDNTIRLWQADAPSGDGERCSDDLLRIAYVNENAEGERAEPAAHDGKTGLRVLAISPDGRHLAAGDRCGNLRVFGANFLDELVKIEAHDAEVTCLAFSPASTGVTLLATASRDRLIHVFNPETRYSLEQTLSDHSAAVTAVAFTGESPEVRMVSCGADKSIYFQRAEQATEGVSFLRSHHVVEKTTLYDMDRDPTGAHVIVACQDRNVRVYDVQTGKLKKCLKGSSGDEGALLKVHLDPSGAFLATSCSDKNICVLDYETGERVATLFGHAEIVTCMRFSQDCRRLITASGDSCVFVWRLDAQMTGVMRKRRGLTAAPESCSHRVQSIRRETFITLPPQEEEDLKTPARPEPAADPLLLQTNGKLPMWFRRLQAQVDAPAADQSGAEPRQARGRWAVQPDRLIDSSDFATRREEEEEEEEEEFTPQSLESLLGGGEEVCRRTFILDAADREVKGQEQPGWGGQLSPDSACSEGSAGSLDPPPDGDTDSLSQGSSGGGSSLEDEDDRDSLKNHFHTLATAPDEETFDTDLRALPPPDEKHFLNPRFSISARFLSRFQDRMRALQGGALPPVSMTTRISEESDIGDAAGGSTGSSDTTAGQSEPTAGQSEPTAGQSEPTAGQSEPTAGQSEPTAGQSEPTEPRGVRRNPPPVLRRRNSSVITHQPLCHPARRRRHTVVVVQSREILKDVTSRAVASSVQQGAPRLGYLGTTASSRAKLTQDPPTSSPEEEKENLSSCPAPHGATPAPHQGGASSDAPSAPTPTSPQALATPTEVGGFRQWSVSSVEDTPTNQNQTLIQVPAPSSTSSLCDLSASSAPKQEEGPVGSETRTRTDPGPGDDDLGLLLSQHVAGDLRRAAQRAGRLYRQLAGSDRRAWASVLQEAFHDVDSELRSLAPPGGWRGGGDGAPSGPLEEDGEASLLERYSDQLVQMVQNKLNHM